MSKESTERSAQWWKSRYMNLEETYEQDMRRFPNEVIERCASLVESTMVFGPPEKVLPLLAKMIRKLKAKESLSSTR